MNKSHRTNFTIICSTIAVVNILATDAFRFYHCYPVAHYHCSQEDRHKCCATNFDNVTEFIICYKNILGVHIE